jgi:mono/diheme cytochrome c family protein
LHSRQLDGAFAYPNGREVDQFAQLQHIGLGGELSDVTPLADPTDESASVEERARAYLHVNCALCHRAGIDGTGSFDLHVDTELVDTAACDAEPAAGHMDIEDARLIAPGDPDRSVLLARVLSDDIYRMPPFGSVVVDDAGAAVVEAWIEALEDCPETPSDDTGTEG